MKENHRCEAALRSPAHITLIPPFWMRPEPETELIHSITEFSSSQNAFPVQLNNFSCFEPKVLFINVASTKELNVLKNDLQNYLLSTDKFPLQKDDRPFHPHVTIATRDLYKKAFYEAWEHFKEKKYAAAWMTEGISLLKHNKKNWDVVYTSQFQLY
jgi:2'-5' RNA ligase